MALDASFLFLSFFTELHATWVAHVGVNLAESLIRIRDRQPTLYPMLERQILGGMIRFNLSQQATPGRWIQTLCAQLNHVVLKELQGCLKQV